MNIIFLKVNIALFGNPSIFAVDYESIDMKQLIFIFTVAWGAVAGSRAQEVLTLDDCLRWGIEITFLSGDSAMRFKKANMLFLKTVPSYYRKLMEWLILTTTSILQCP